jgi:hypothetical protein
MKHLKKFENFYLSPDVDSDEQEWQDYSKEIRTGSKISDRDQDEQEISTDRFSDRGQDDEFTDEMSDEIIGRGEIKDEMSDETDEFSGGHIMRFDEAKKSYKKGSKKSKPDFLDLDKDGNKKESMKKAAKDAKAKNVKSNKKGLTAAQEKLPAPLQKAILDKKK